MQYHGPTRHPDDGISNNNEILSGSAISGVADKSTSGAASEGSNYDKLMTINNIESNEPITLHPELYLNENNDNLESAYTGFKFLDNKPQV